MDIGPKYCRVDAATTASKHYQIILGTDLVGVVVSLPDLHNSFSEPAAEITPTNCTLI